MFDDSTTRVDSGSLVAVSERDHQRHCRSHWHGQVAVSKLEPRSSIVIIMPSLAPGPQQMRYQGASSGTGALMILDAWSGAGDDGDGENTGHDWETAGLTVGRDGRRQRRWKRTVATEGTEVREH